MNLNMAHAILQKLAAYGVRELCLCAGARNAPFVELLSPQYLFKQDFFKVYSFFEERAASFFALGRIQQNQRPVALVTTSGTAAAELLPAMVEAYYSAHPLIVITADRPKSYRQSGAPQAIEQMGLYSHYVLQDFDWDYEAFTKAQVKLPQSVLPGPLHLNVRFDEPLLGTLTTDKPLFSEIEKEAKVNWAQTLTSDHLSQSLVQKFFQKIKSPVIIVSSLPEPWRAAVEDYLLELGQPIYAEASSGLRNSTALKNLILKSGSEVLTKLLEKKLIDGVMRIGGVPTTRFWRDLEDIQLPVLSVSHRPFSGLSWNPVRPIAYEQLFAKKGLLKKAPESLDAIFALDREKRKSLERLIKKYPNSEPTYFRALSEFIQKKSQVFIGNSLPVREWDLCATYENNLNRFYVNRGANGIDGLVSSFLGVCDVLYENWCIVGDLSAFYDLNALSMVNHLGACNINIVVINNQGGSIFSRMFANSAFLNSHNFEFSSWATMFGFNYQKLNRSHNELKPLAQKTILEIQPDFTETESFWSEFEKIWPTN